MKEDKKILEELIKNANTEDTDMNDVFFGEHIEAIENVLAELKRQKFLVQDEENLRIKYAKELKESKEENFKLAKLIKNSISKDKIKTKIEEYVNEKLSELMKTIPYEIDKGTPEQERLNGMQKGAKDILKILLGE